MQLVCDRRRDDDDGFANFDSKLQELRVVSNTAIENVTSDIEAIEFNTAVSQLHILSNALNQAVGGSADIASHHEFGEHVRTMVLLLAPFAPHIASELWEQLGASRDVHAERWPRAVAVEIDDLDVDTISVAVAVNGKHRGNLNM